MGSCGLMGVEFQFHKMKSSGDWLYNNVNILNATKTVHIKIIKRVNFMLGAFYHNLKNGMALPLNKHKLCITPPS